MNTRGGWVRFHLHHFHQFKYVQNPVAKETEDRRAEPMFLVQTWMIETEKEEPIPMSGFYHFFVRQFMPLSIFLPRISLLYVFLGIQSCHGDQVSPSNHRPQRQRALNQRLLSQREVDLNKCRRFLF